jgi:hypothetical protein
MRTTADKLITAEANIHHWTERHDRWIEEREDRLVAYAVRMIGYWESKRKELLDGRRGSGQG